MKRTRSGRSENVLSVNVWKDRWQNGERMHVRGGSSDENNDKWLKAKGRWRFFDLKGGKGE